MNEPNSHGPTEDTAFRTYNELALFLKRLATLLVPVLVVFSIPIACLIKAGEIYPYSAYIHPLEKNQLFGLAYSYYDKEYKLSMTNYYKPDVIALGSSRIMTFKEDIINRDYTFYNAGGAIQNIYELNLFIQKCQFNPKLVFVTLDQYWFNPVYRDQKQEFSSKVYDPPSWRFSKIIVSCRDIVYDYIKGKIIIDSLMNSKHIGLNAICNHHGFSKDGTRDTDRLFYNPDYIKKSYEDTFSRIAQGDRRFEYCDHAETKVTEAIDMFLDECEKRGITVMAFIPPYAPSLCRKMWEMGKFNYMHEIYGILEPHFKKHKGCYLYDYTDMKDMGIHDYDYTDGFHGSVLVSNTILQDILDKNDALKKYFVSKETMDSINTAFRLQNNVENPQLKELSFN